MLTPDSNVLKTYEDLCRFEQASSFEQRCPARSVFDLFAASAQKVPDRIALTMVRTGLDGEEAQRVTYRELLALIRQAANLFSTIHGRHRPGVAYLLPNMVETYVTLWAAEAVGYAVPVNYFLSPQAIADLIKASGASILVALGPSPHFDIWAKALRVKTALPELKLVAINDCSGPDSTTLDFYGRLQTQPTERLIFGEPGQADELAAYFHTGGTTGAPKLVGHSHRNQIVAAFGGAVMANMREDDVVLNGFPLFHVAGTIFNGLSCSMSGAEIVILSPAGFRNPEMLRRYWRLAERYRATRIGGVPTVIAALCNVEVASADLSSVRYAACGAASTPRAVAERFESHTGQCLHEVLGMTETAGITCIDPADGERVIGSVGFRLPYTHITIRQLKGDGALGATCAPFEAGVLVVSGPTVSHGYASAGQNKGGLSNGQLNSGDLAYMTPEGRVFIVGRAKDLIIRSGHNIDPLMIEDVMTRHPGVRMAAAVAQPDEYAGELPVCYVVLQDGVQVTEDELRTHAETQLAERPAWPRQFYVVTEIPVTGVGKIFKPALRADAARRLVCEILAREYGIQNATVNVHESEKHGTVVAITLSLQDEEQIPRILGTFANFLFTTRIDTQ